MNAGDFFLVRTRGPLARLIRVVTRSAYNLHVGDVREEKLMETVAKFLVNWNSDGIRAFEACKGLYETEYNRLAAAGHEPLFLASDAVGKWIVWNVLGRAPESQDECMLVRATGTLITHAFFDWWKK